VEKLYLYIQIHQLNDQGFSKSAIARKLGVCRNTVYTYLRMSLDEANEWIATLDTRRKKLDPYHKLVLSWLKEHPDMTASQVEDWLKEKYPNLQISDSAVRNYVREVRDVYHIPRSLNNREYIAVEELPMGLQAQVDWGEFTSKNTDGKSVKLYFIVFVLSHSRYKYVEWLDRPFTIDDAIRCHENAFYYFGGIPEEIVYDQDHLIAVSENAGDIILTDKFAAYKKERGFRLYLCRKSDPESKGKIENVVKYVKLNFAKHRVFPNLEMWNEKCLAWLERKGNKSIHNTTKKRPAEVHALEKQHLRPVSTVFSYENNSDPSITRTVHKDNIIKYKSNRYSLPIGTYKPKAENRVFIEVADDFLIIRTSSKGEILAKHPLCKGKGELIKSRGHAQDYSKGIKAFKETIISQFKDQESATKFIDELSVRYPRHIRDQLQVMQHVINKFSDKFEEALQICCKKQLWSANDLRDLIRHQEHLRTSSSTLPIKLPSTAPSPLNLVETAATRDMDVYLDILGGVANGLDS